MNKLTRWWSSRPARQKWVLGVGAGVLVIATAGALAYAVATGGAIIVSGETTVAVGPAAIAMARRLARPGT
jgi:hypothetical protein